MIGKKEFAITALHLKNKAFVVYLTSISKNSDVYLFCRAQIAFLKADKAPVFISSKYANFAKVFSKNLVAKLSELIGINDHIIDLIEGHQALYKPIYSLGPVGLNTLKTYIETNLANGFIKHLKYPTSTLILFDKKPDRSL